MKFLNPPSKLEKKDAEGNQLPNIVKITNRALHPESEEGDKFEIPAEKFIYPQVESKEEAEQICGGADRFLEVFNDFLRDSALTESKNKIRMASSGTYDDIVNSGINAGKNFTFVETAKITAAEAKEKFSELRNLASKETMTDEELAAKVRAMLGL